MHKLVGVTSSQFARLTISLALLVAPTGIILLSYCYAYIIELLENHMLCFGKEMKSPSTKVLATMHWAEAPLHDFPCDFEIIRDGESHSSCEMSLNIAHTLSQKKNQNSQLLYDKG